MNFTEVCTWSISIIFSFVSITSTSSSLSFFFAPEIAMLKIKIVREVMVQTPAKLKPITASQNYLFAKFDISL